MDTKSVVVKSKSSNSGVSNKKDKYKISRSDAELQPLNIKKRGVYVENKEKQLLNIYESNDTEIKKKPPPRPRPGKKRFLASVLNILSKSTTGTQCPDTSERTKRKMAKKHKQYHENIDTDYQFMTPETKIKSKKHKYKSKILNGDNFVPFNEKLVILQSKKEIIHTPSNFSESRSFTISDSKNPIRELLENNIYSGVADSLAKQIVEGRTDKTEKLKEPTTLVSEAPKEDKKIYNFFVDLLETTFDIYNVETEHVPSKESQTLLEIEETVAKKLILKNDKPKEEPAELNFKIQEETSFPFQDAVEKPPKILKKKVTKPISLKSQSFVYSKPKFLPKTYSVGVKKKPQSKKAKKQDLLNTIKEELKMDFMTYEEPQNLYQALRNMAKYKRKCQQKKTIHFEYEDTADFESKCLFSRGIFPKKIKKRKNIQEKINQKPMPIVTKVMKPKRSPAIRPSNHSLKVYGVEYLDNNELSRKCSSSSHFTEVDSFGPGATFGFSNTSLDIKDFYALIQD